MPTVTLSSLQQLQLSLLLPPLYFVTVPVAKWSAAAAPQNGLHSDNYGRQALCDGVLRAAAFLNL